MTSQINTQSNHSVSVLKRTGDVVPFEASKVRKALTNAFLRDEHGNLWMPTKEVLSAGEVEMVEQLIEQIASALSRQPNIAVHIEDIQDQVELALMRKAPHNVAAAYIIYRERHANVRRQRTQSSGEPLQSQDFTLPACPMRSPGSGETECDACQ